MSTDVLTRLQTEYNQLLTQYFSTYSYLAQRHPLVPPQEIPGLRFTSQSITSKEAGAEDADPEKVAFPLQPHDKGTFEAAQHELAEDLVFKTRQIQQLIARLPGIDQDEQRQAEEIRRLAVEVEKMERQRKAKRREMRKLVTRLDAVIGGMSKSVDVAEG